MQLDRKDEAIKELDAMVAGDLASGETYLRLAKILRRFGDDKLAREALVRAKTFTDRTFDRLYLEWQIDADEKILGASGDCRPRDARRSAKRS